MIINMEPAVCSIMTYFTILWSTVALQHNVVHNYMVLDTAKMEWWLNIKLSKDIPYLALTGEICIGYLSGVIWKIIIVKYEECTVFARAISFYPARHSVLYWCGWHPSLLSIGLFAEPVVIPLKTRGCMLRKYWTLTRVRLLVWLWVMVFI